MAGASAATTARARASKKRCSRPSQRPDAVRCVITLGSPIGGHPHASNARRIYEFTSGQSAADPHRWRHITQAPPVLATAIYSRSDGIVAWQTWSTPANLPQRDLLRTRSA